MRVVICGAGTSGCVLAARLSEEPGLAVTLLEAGPHYRPGRWPAELAHSHRIVRDSHDWGWWARAGASPRLVHVPRGRVVGGSSATNGAIALRGHPAQYDEWAAYAEGWDWAALLPWFRALERDLDFPEAPWHGAAGPIPISRYPRESWYELQAPLLRGRPRRRPPRDRRPQRPGRARARRDPAQHGRRRAPDPGRPLPGPGPRPGQPAPGERRGGRPGAPRGRARGRGRGPGPGRAPGPLGGRRGHPGPRHLRQPGLPAPLGRRPGGRAAPPRHPGGPGPRRGGPRDAGPPQDLLPLRPGRARGPALARALVPGAPDRDGRGPGRAAHLPGHALQRRRGRRAALHRPERAALGRALAPGDRASGRTRPAGPAGHRDGLAAGGRRPRGRARRGRGPARPGRPPAAARGAGRLAQPVRPGPRPAHGRDLPPPGGHLSHGARRRPGGGGRRRRARPRPGRALGHGRRRHPARSLGQHPPGGDRAWPSGSGPPSAPGGRTVAGLVPPGALARRNNCLRALGTPGGAGR